MSDILELTPGSDADVASLFLERLEGAVNNSKIPGLTITDKEARALLEWALALQSEILFLRATYEADHDQSR